MSAVGETHVRTAKATRDPTPERVIQKLGIDLLRRTGWTVWRVGQYNARRTQDAGVPDVIAAKGQHLIFVEFKRASGGVQSDDQKKFEDAAVSAGVPYYLISDVQVLAGLLANLNRAAA